MNPADGFPISDYFRVDDDLDCHPIASLFSRSWGSIMASDSTYIPLPQASLFDEVNTNLNFVDLREASFSTPDEDPSPGFALPSKLGLSRVTTWTASSVKMLEPEKKHARLFHV